MNRTPTGNTVLYSLFLSLKNTVWDGVLTR
jgi:hypothetical protein